MGACKLATLLAVVRSAAEARLIEPPDGIDQVIRGLDGWALDLAVSWHQRQLDATSEGGGRGRG